MKSLLSGIRRELQKALYLRQQTQIKRRQMLPLNGFYAGAFTYNLTQYLWQQTSTPESAIAYVVPNIAQEFNQTPRYEVKVGSGNEKQPIYFINNASSAADAVITEVKGALDGYQL